MNHKTILKKGVAVTGAIPMWSRIVTATLNAGATLLPEGSDVVEVGYGDGYLSCYLADRYGWKITGFDILDSAYNEANRHARELGVEDKLNLHLVKPEETWKHKGQYDGCFVKTVLYNATSLKEYASWLDWVQSVLKPGGIFINFENGKANMLTYLYRKLRGRYYADLCMFDEEIMKLYSDRFEILHVAHYGAISQFFAPVAPVYNAMAFVEETFFNRNAGNSYITAIVARKR